MKTIPKLDKVQEEKARELHEKAVLINMMDSTTLRSYDKDYCEKLIQAGVTALNTTVNLNVSFRPWEGLPEVVRQFYMWYDKLNFFDEIIQIRKAEDIEQAKRDRKTGIILGFQNPNPIDSDINLLKIFYQLGLRVCGVAYTRRNTLADGCGEKTDCGLSRIGEVFVEELNNLHVLIDLSHCQTKSSFQIMELSRDPVAFTHSNPRGAYNHLRNLTDEQIHACAEKGGVIGVNGFSTFLHPKGLEEGATVADAVEHIDYIVDLVGANHVGIGLDCTGSRTVEEALELQRAYPELGSSPETPTLESIRRRYALKSILDIRDYARGLVAKGYSDQQILRILGGNWLNLFKEVWK